MKTDEVAAVHDEDSHSPSSENLTTTEELPAKMGARNKPSPQSKQDDPLSQESAEALFFDVTDAVGMDDYPEEIKIAESPAPPAARSLLDMPPAQLQAELAAPAPAPAAIAPPPPPSNIIECPCPPDVLMPVEGYQLWSGNARYLHLVATRQPEFLQVAGRSEQARIALEILHAIQLDGGRFLTAVDIPPTENALPTNNSSIVRTTVWELMKETEVLGQLGKALRTTEGEARKQEKKEKKQRRKEKKRKRKERRRARRRERALVVEASDEEQVSPSTLGALQSLYYVPSYYPVAEDHSKNSLECESDSILTSSSSSSEEEPTALPVAKRRVVRKSKAGVAPSPVARAAAKKPEAASAEKNKEISFHYKPKPMKSQQAALDNEGECNLPKGVTVRPSGKWVCLIELFCHGNNSIPFCSNTYCLP